VGAVLLALALLSTPGVRRLTRSGRWAGVVVAALLVAAIFRDSARIWWGGSSPVGTPRQIVALHVDEAGGGAAAFLRARLAEGPVRHVGYDAAWLRDRPDGRRGTYHARHREAAVQALLVGHRAVRLKLFELQGYNPVQNRRYVEFLRALNGRAQNYHDAYIRPSGLDSPLLDLLNARYTVVPAAVPPGRPDLLHLSQRHPTVYGDAAVRVLERRGALPRAWIVHETRQVEQGQGLRLLVDGAVDPRRVALLEVAPPVLAPPADAAADRAAVDRYESDRIELTVQTDAPGLLVLSEVYDPGWRAYVDGRRVPVLVADHVLRAVPVPAGAHAVELRYEPAGLRVGLGITLATAGLVAILWGGLGWRSWWRGSRGASGAGPGAPVPCGGSRRSARRVGRAVP
jgi:Bacterial membrane protein YfhO